MANLLYPLFKEAILDSDNAIDLVANTIKVALLTSGYSYSAAHDFYNDLGANVVGTDQTLANKTIALGVFDADDATWAGLTGSAVSYLAIYKDTGNAATSRLIAYFDTITGFPLTPSGADLTVRWSSGASRIFAL